MCLINISYYYLQITNKANFSEEKFNAEEFDIFPLSCEVRKPTCFSYKPVHGSLYRYLMTSFHICWALNLWLQSVWDRMEGLHDVLKEIMAWQKQAWLSWRKQSVRKLHLWKNTRMHGCMVLARWKAKQKFRVSHPGRGNRTRTQI